MTKKPETMFLVQYFYRCLPILFLLLPGCAQKLTFLEESALLQDTELTTTPFFPQKDYQCGPAALATILASSGVDVQPESLKKHVYLPKRKGSLQLELIAASRSFGRIPYTIEPELVPIANELRAGNPVLVLQNFGTTSTPIYHYAVVVGLSPEDGVILRSGRTQRQMMPASHFLSTVRRANSWALIVLKPGEFPVDGNLQRFIKTLAALESTGRLDMAETAYRSLLAQFPDDATIMFGLANTLAMNNQAEEAVHVYNQLLKSHPSHLPAINNLADTLAQEHCYNKALLILENGIAQSNQQSEFSPILHNTFGEITTRSMLYDNAKCTLAETSDVAN